MVRVLRNALLRPRLWRAPPERARACLLSPRVLQLGMFGGAGGGVFSSSFRAYPVSFIDKARLFASHVQQRVEPKAGPLAAAR